MKPHLRRSMGHWACMSRGFYGIGETFHDAYSQWLNLREYAGV